MKNNNKKNGQRQGTGKILLALAAEKLDISVEKAVRYMQHLGYTVKKATDAYISPKTFKELEKYAENKRQEEIIIAQINKGLPHRPTTKKHHRSSWDGNLRRREPSDDIKDDEIRVLGKEKNDTTKQIKEGMCKYFATYLNETDNESDAKDLLIEMKNNYAKIFSLINVNLKKMDALYEQMNGHAKEESSNCRSNINCYDDPYDDDDDDYYYNPWDDGDDMEIEPEGYPDDWDW